MNLTHSVRLAMNGSDTIDKHGGEAIGYQGRKAARTTNSLVYG
ncbi:hypothetical protein [Rhodocytophaga rosea]|nr:hypothetical protein [Rhodocytophaga rosea]